ncbi:MAG: hypothetical protein KIT31_42460 [Deltaproteobacteria bacterium]|nr:hypothetical protein [Deltaproteobacteria bacterium]
MKRRGVGGVTVAVGAVLLLVGALAPTWWALSEGSHTTLVTARLGLRTVEACERACMSISYSELIGGATTARLKAFMAFGNMAFWGALVATALGALAVALAFLRPHAAAPVARITMVLALVLLLLAIAFVLTRVDIPGAGVGYALIAYMLGAPTVGAGAWQLARPEVPVAGGIPACPRCQAPTEWEAQHARFMCRGCSVYV